MSAVSPDAIFGAVVTAGLAAAGGFTWLVRRLGQLDSTEEVVRSLGQKIEGVNDKVDGLATLVSKELTHNGGSSTKDMAKASRDDAALAVRMVEAVHRRLDSTEKDRAYSDGEKKAKLDKLQHDMTAVRTYQALHAYESERAMTALREHGIDVPPMTHPDGSPLT